MICEVCISYVNDSQDALIRFICGHHPACENFQINKDTFLIEFLRQVELQTQKNFNKIQPSPQPTKPYLINKPVNEVSSSSLIKKLHSYLISRYFPIVPNIYFFDWESDLLAINKDSQYISEYEIKISRNDFKADFKKQDKHRLIADCYNYKFSSNIPNYFYYATTPGLLDKSEIPNYAGLIELGLSTRIVKKAPLIHKDKISENDIDKLLKKVYYKYWSLK